MFGSLLVLNEEEEKTSTVSRELTSPTVRMIGSDAINYIQTQSLCIRHFVSPYNLQQIVVIHHKLR